MFKFRLSYIWGSKSGAVKMFTASPGMIVSTE